jgi:hypothetical protein
MEFEMGAGKLADRKGDTGIPPAFEFVPMRLIAPGAAAADAPAPNWFGV